MTSTLRLLADHLRAGIRASVLLAVLVAVTVFIVAIVPRAAAAVATAELSYQLGQEKTVSLDLSAEGRLNFIEPTSDSTAEELLAPIGDAIEAFPSGLPTPLADGVGEAIWVVKSASAMGRTAALDNTRLSLRLAVDLGTTERVRYVSGDAPLPWKNEGGTEEVGPGDPADGQDELSIDTSNPIDIAISQESATLMKLGVGDIVQYSPAPLRVAGIYEPIDPDDSYWSHTYDLARASIINETGKPPTIQATVYVAPDSIGALAQSFLGGILAAWVPVDPTAYSFADREALATQVRNLTATPISLPLYEYLTLRTSFSDVLENTEAKVAAMTALVALSASGLFGVLVATYALSIQTLVRRRRFSLSLASARGASFGQLRGVMVIESALIAVPGAVVAMAAAAIVLPERVGIDGWLAPVTLALIPIALAAILVSPGSLRESRQDISVRSKSRFRWIAEAVLAGAAIVALVLLQRRGLVASSDVGVDPLLAATPLLLAAAIGLLALRVFPIPLRAVRALVRGRVAPVAEVGSARAIREPAISAIAALALIVGVSIVLFSTIMISTVGASIERAAAETVGADARVNAHDLPDSLLEEIRGLPEVTAAAALTVPDNLNLTDEAGTTSVRVLLVDPAALAAVRPDLRDLGPATDSPTPILVSQALSEILRGTKMQLGEVAVQQTGVVSDASIPGMTGKWLIVDEAVADELGLPGETPTSILIGLDDDYSGSTMSAIQEAVLAVQPQQFVGSARFFDVRTELALRRAAPTTSGVEGALVITAGATLLLTLLIVALAAAASAASRNRVVGVLRVIGMTPRQVRALVAWEFGPVAIAALLVGTGIGIGLPYLVTAVIDLRGFFGGTTLPEPSLVPLWIVSAVGTFAVTVVAAILVAAALGRRFAPASTLKMGES